MQVCRDLNRPQAEGLWVIRGCCVHPVHHLVATTWPVCTTMAPWRFVSCCASSLLPGRMDREAMLLLSVFRRYSAVRFPQSLPLCGFCPSDGIPYQPSIRSSHRPTPPFPVADKMSHIGLMAMAPGIYPCITWPRMAARLVFPCPTSSCAVGTVIDRSVQVGWSCRCG